MADTIYLSLSKLNLYLINNKTRTKGEKINWEIYG